MQDRFSSTFSIYRSHHFKPNDLDLVVLDRFIVFIATNHNLIALSYVMVLGDYKGNDVHYAVNGSVLLTHHLIEKTYLSSANADYKNVTHILKV